MITSLKANGTTFTPHHLSDRVSSTLTMNDSITPAGLCIHNGTLDRVTASVTATKTKRSTEHLPLCIVAHVHVNIQFTATKCSQHEFRNYLTSYCTNYLRHNLFLAFLLNICIDESYINIFES